MIMVSGVGKAPETFVLQGFNKFLKTLKKIVDK